MSRHVIVQPPAGSSRKESRPSTPAFNDWDDLDHPRSSFSTEATPRPTATPVNVGIESYSSNNILLTTNEPLLPKRLGFFTDKLSAATSQSQTHSTATSAHRASPVPPHSGLLPPRSHSRADSGPWEPTMASLSSTANISKVHTSPSKVSDKHSRHILPSSMIIVYRQNL
jgi:hypothetical protein